MFIHKITSLLCTLDIIYQASNFSVDREISEWARWRVVVCLANQKKELTETGNFSWRDSTVYRKVLLHRTKYVWAPTVCMCVCVCVCRPTKLRCACGHGCNPCTLPSKSIYNIIYLRNYFQLIFYHSSKFFYWFSLISRWHYGPLNCGFFPIAISFGDQMFLNLIYFSYSSVSWLLWWIECLYVVQSGGSVGQAHTHT
jgi:hypothetical protein